MPVNSVIRIGRPVTFDLPADGHMVPIEASANLSEAQTVKN